MAINIKPVGGRGKKADYETKTVRVPVPVLPLVEKAIEDFREKAVTSLSENDLITYEQALEEAKKIIKSKKSASESLVKLINFIYSSTLTKDELR